MISFCSQYRIQEVCARVSGIVMRSELDVIKWEAGKANNEAEISLIKYLR